jgi:adenylosuccinate synthase
MGIRKGGTIMIEEHNERFEKGLSSLDIVIGGQWGSEGKGEIMAAMVKEKKYDLAVRVGGPNAGHTYHYGGPSGDDKIVVQSLPIATSMAPGQTIGIIGAGAVFIPELLFKEISTTARREDCAPMVYIDRNASIITEAHQNQEKIRLVKEISSTGEGVGAATAATVMRDPKVAANTPENLAMLENLIETYPGCERVHLGQNTPEIINRSLDSGMRVMLEGTQGWALGLHTSGYYPYCTSREVSPWALCSQSGTNLRKGDLIRIIMVIRTFPIRVGGPSGPLPHEISWEDLARETGNYVKEPEITTVTKKPRRIAKMDMALLHEAKQICGPTGLAVTFLDYKWPELVGLEPEDWHDECFDWLRSLSSRLGVHIEYVSMGPGDVYSTKSNRHLARELLT